MMDDELPEITEIQRFTLKPDDAIVVRCPQNISMQQAETVKDRVSARLGIDSSRVLVLGNGITLDVVTTP